MLITTENDDDWHRGEDDYWREQKELEVFGPVEDRPVVNEPVVNETVVEPFQYDELPCVNSLRILWLLPGRSTEVLHVTLETVPKNHVAERLSTCEALSYAWGSPVRTWTVTCNGRQLSITTNLRIALQAIRQPNKKRQIWVDAICIDQTNIKERNHQIKLMTQIYSTAKQVLVWLGPADTGTPVARHVQKMAKRSCFIHKTLADGRLRGSLMRSLKRLASSPWFGRMWTMQEIGLASKATVMYGHVKIDWHHLISAYRLVEAKFPRKYLMTIGFEPSQVTCLSGWRSPLSGDTFLELLVATERRKTTDPRDRIFALLSHAGAKVETTHGEPTELLIEADYSRSIVDIYTHLAKRLLAISGCLDVLSYIRGCEGRFGLPSWAPMWNETREGVHCLLGSHIRFTADGSHSSTSPWTSSRTDIYSLEQTEQHITARVDNHQLCVMSVDIGRISWRFERAREKYIERFWKPMVYLLQPGEGVLDVWEQFNEAASGRLEVDLLQTYAELITCGLVHPQYEEETGKKLYARHFEAFWRTAVNENEAGAALSRAKTKAKNKKRRDCKRFQNAIDYASEKRVLFCTDTGYMGLGPDSIRVGDEACILEGGKVPYILREADNGHCSLVGECYISGAMHGELVSRDKFNPSKVKRKIIV